MNNSDNVNGYKSPELRKHLESRHYSVYSWLTQDEITGIRELKEGEILRRLRDLLLKDTLFSTGLFFGSIALGLASFQILLALLAMTAVLISLLYLKDSHDKDSYRQRQASRMLDDEAHPLPSPMPCAGSEMKHPALPEQKPPMQVQHPFNPVSSSKIYCQFLIPLNAAAYLPAPSQKSVFSHHPPGGRLRQELTSWE